MAHDPWNVAAIERLAPDEKSVAAARELLKKKAFGKVQARADGRGWWAKVRGLTDDYEVSVPPPTSTPFVPECTCPSSKQPCKHAIGLLLYLAAHPAQRPGLEVPPAPGADFEALLAGVFAHPDDDAARLVFADFVEEQGDGDRARLIRLQVQRSRKPTQKGRAERALPKGEAAIVRALVADLPEWVWGHRAQRGFLHLTLPTQTLDTEHAAWPESLERLFRLGWVERLAYDGVPHLTEAFRQLCGRVGTLDLGSATLGSHYLPEVAALLTPGALPGRLKQVLVPHRNKAQWKQLAADPGRAPVTGVPDQTEVDFEDTPLELFRYRVARGDLDQAHRVGFYGRLNPGVVAAFAGSPGAAACRDLRFSDCRLEAADAAALSASPHLVGVERLSLNSTAWGDGAAAAWLASALVGRAEWLGLAPVDRLTDAHLAALERRPTPALHELGLGAGDYTAGALESLLRSRGPTLRQVYLQWAPRSAREFLALRLRLAEGPRVLASGDTTATFEALGAGRHLTLGGRDAWPHDAHTLHWSGVTGLTLEGVPLEPDWFDDLPRCTPGGLAHLGVRSAGLKVRHGPPLVRALEAIRPATLDLRSNHLGVTTVKLIVNSPGAANLETLDLSSNHLQASALEALLASPHLGRLRHLSLGRQQEGFDAKTRQSFTKRAPPAWTVDWD